MDGTSISVVAVVVVGGGGGLIGEKPLVTVERLAAC